MTNTCVSPVAAAELEVPVPGVEMARSFLVLGAIELLLSFAIALLASAR